MAFYTSGLPNVAAATTELWPSIANTVMIPWRGPTSTPSPKYSPPRHAARPASTPSEAASVSDGPNPRLPVFLRSVDLSTLQHSAIDSATTSSDIRQVVANIPKTSFSAASPISSPHQGSSTQPARSRLAQNCLHRLGLDLSPIRNASHLQSGPRFMSTFRTSGVLPSKCNTFAPSFSPIKPFTRILPQQQRSMSTGGISRNLLANREAAANRNPNSATAQNAFYQVLLKANMPMIVVERYNSGRFAANEATTEAYQRALGMLSSGHAVGAADLTGQGGVAANNTHLNAAQLQAVGQALAAQTRGGNIAVAKGAQGTGAKDAPIHVVVDQPISDILFRWIKFLLWFCLFTYLSLVVVTMMIEGLNQFKRPGGRLDNEAKAENQTTRFSDVHGCDEAKEELQELVEFLKNPDRFSTLGGKLPKGILLVGPPGTGKTLLARAVAGEAGVPFFYMSGSEFDEVYVGVGAKRVRDLFTAAKGKAPAIVFIDELDAIGGRRNARDAAYVKQTLNQLLTELDGFEQNSGVIILAATNFPELLDKALTRPGRFDRHVTVPLPDVRGRLAILKHHAKKIKAASEVDLQAIALQTSGMSGAELESIVNQAAIHASKAKSIAVSMKDFDWAKDKVIMGAERKSMVISPKEKEMTAYHEAGHALVSYYHKTGPSQLYKVTILPRGRSLGHTSQLPEMDRYSFSLKDYLISIEIALGGKLAEEIVYGSDMVTSGVSSDLETATSIAFQMVAQLGMSSKLGPVEYQNRYKELSSETRALIESEVQKTLSDSYERAKQLLLSKRKELDLLAKALVEYETLDKSEVAKVIAGEKLPDRIPVPLGPMTVPKPANPLDALPPLSGAEGDNENNGPPPPAPPGTI